MLQHKGLPLIRHILSPFIVSECLNRSTSLLFCPSLIVLEGREGLAFGMEKPAASESCSIISERNPVLVAISSRRERAMEVRVNKLQRHRTTRGDRREGVSSLLPIHASRADWEQGRSGRLGEREARDHLKLNKRFEAIR
jgi:hypothetical protein